MIDTEKGALNEKLSKWVWPDARIKVGDNCIDVEIPRSYGYECVAVCPDFCSSLDAQAKYLWLKLKNCELTIYPISGHPMAHLVNYGEVITKVTECADNTALACALVIGKLIDQEAPK